MEPRSRHGGRHELGQNFLQHRPTIDRIVALVTGTDDAILELGAGDGALTRPLSTLGRDLRAIDIDEHRVGTLRRRLPGVRVEHGDALRVQLDRPVIVGNLPFHLTTPILRRLLSHDTWRDAVLLVQWEVARKRAGVGGRTMMTAQTDPWFEFALHGRVPAHAFRPRPTVDGGLLSIHRRTKPLLDVADRHRYERFVKAMFTGRGTGARQLLGGAVPGLSARDASAILVGAGVEPTSLPRDLAPKQWAALWAEVRRSTPRERR